MKDKKCGTCKYCKQGHCNNIAVKLKIIPFWYEAVLYEVAEGDGEGCWAWKERDVTDEG